MPAESWEYAAAKDHLRETALLRRDGRADLLRDYKCSHSIEALADRWPDDVRLSNIEPRFVCTACGRRGADVRPNFHWQGAPVGGHGLSQELLRHVEGADEMVQRERSEGVAFEYEVIA